MTNIGIVQFYIGAQEKDAKAINTAGRQRLLLQTMMTEAERINGGDLDRRDGLTDAARKYDQALAEMRSGTSGHPVPNSRQSQRIETISARWTEFFSQVNILATAEPQSEPFRDAYGFIRDQKPVLLEQSDRLVTAYQRASEQKLQSIQNWIIGLVIVDLVVLVGIWATISRSIIRPLETLRQDTKAVARGDLDREINNSFTDDELGMATRSVQELAGQLEEALEEARGFQEAVEQAGHSIYITDTGGTIEYVNPAFERITGYSAEEAIGNSPALLSSEERPESFYEDLWQEILSGEIWEGK